MAISTVSQSDTERAVRRAANQNLMIAGGNHT